MDQAKSINQEEISQSNKSKESNESKESKESKKSKESKESNAQAYLDKNIKKLNAQVEETYKFAFYNLLEERVSSNPPDCDWLTRLYGEIRLKLTQLLKKDSHLRKEIEESMDLELFDQMIRHNALNMEDFHKIIKYVFAKCHQLQSPGRDKETNERLEDISELIMSGNATFGSVVPLFIRNANYCLDLIYKDIENLSDVLKQANR